MKQLKISVEPVTEAKLTARASQTGTSVSEYVRQLIERDLAGGGEAQPPDSRRQVVQESRGEPAELLPRIHELVTLTAVLIRAQLTANLGEQSAQRIQDLAEDKTAQLLRRLPAGD